MKKLAILFGMSENERRGFLVLSVITGLIGITPFIYSFYVKQTTDDILLISSTVQDELKTFERHTESTNTIEERSPRKPEKIWNPFPFDPNNLPVEKWKMLGFTDRQIEVIKNYESKGGRFHTKADVAKIYVVSDADFNRIASYITLPETALIQPYKKVAFLPTERVKPSIKKVVVDVSVADTAALKEIYGIGSVLASRIVKFRDALGGFYTIAQVKEVYGISEEQYQEMESSLALGDNFIKKRKINQLSIEELAQHPYISRREATHIVRYREQHGAFASLADLEKMYALNDDFLRKIAPYLEFD